MEGTPEFERYQVQRLKQGKTPQSILKITEQEAQELVDKYACTGTVVVKRRNDGSVEIREFCNAERDIGRCYANNIWHNANRFGIYYSKKGTHVVPVTSNKGE